MSVKPVHGVWIATCGLKEPEDEQRVERGRAICEDALKVINGERQDQYGDPEDSFKKIGDLWTAYLLSGEGRHRSGFAITPAMVADMMCLLKIARESGAQGKRDNAVDLLGYAALAARIRGYDA